MKKSSVIGACVLAAAVVLSVPLGVHTSLTSLREEANSSYYTTRPALPFGRALRTGRPPPAT